MLLVCLLALITLYSVSMARAEDAELSWPAITRQSRPWTRWWWPGNAVDPPNLTRELELMQQAGIGGVEITPIYGVNGYEHRQIPFLSPQWIQMLQHVADEGKRLDLGVDMATRTGWPFGGPMVGPEFVDKLVTRVDGQIGSKPSGMKVKRAAPGGEGMVLNPYSLRGIQHYLKSFDHLPRGIVRAQFHDSFEYAGNWCDELPDRFEQMHGYDLRDHVAEFFGQGDPDAVARVKSDYRQTLAAMHLDYINAWVRWCHEHGYLARNQAHGAPGNLLDLYAAADIPETETFGSTPFSIPGFRRIPEDTDGKNQPNPIISQFASSAAHVAGRQLASCETLTWLREHFKISLAMAKPEIDQMFLAGINHVIYHGTCYSPQDAPWPGWLFYASSEINPRDPLWRDLPLMNAYIARCQAILQSGQPDNDLLLYWPVYDNWHDPEKLEQRFTVHGDQWLSGRPFEQASRELTRLGCGHDYISDDQIAQCTNDGDAIKAPGGVRYRALLLPRVRKIPPQTMQKILELARGGATVLVQGALPQDVPGLGRLEQRRTELKRLGEALMGSGRVVVDDSIDSLVSAVKARCERFVGDGVGMIRRTHEQGHHYFIASLGRREVDQWVRLAVACESVAIMDPMTGRAGLAASRKRDGATEVYLQIEPGQSLILRTFATGKVKGQPWRYTRAAGGPILLTGRWHIEFIDGGPSLPQAIDTDRLASWTDLGDEQARRFAGTARYRIEFDRPATPRPVDGWALDLGDVRESARVKLNGRPIGAAWAVPFRVSFDAAELRDAGNVLEIEVTNLAANRIRDLDLRGVQWRIFKEINFVNINYKPFDASKWDPVPSGLLGPVKLVPLQHLELADGDRS
ncbi:glycosyl hydrolase [Fontivita pretiosa]|uniref:glycosyl hydrolase n=1 Tax=Fontivita pretiosa TaxID=2989684 RepID=UPI003D183EAA